MLIRSRFGFHTRSFPPGRLALAAASVLGGALACVALLMLLGGPAPSVLAAPLATTRPFPSAAPCNASLQACLDGSSPGDTILVQPGHYTASLNLTKPVSLTGVSSATVTLHAVSAQRVLTVTGAAVNSSVVISGLTFAGGQAVGGNCPAGCGGAILITGTAQPRLINLTLTNSVAGFLGGGLFANTGSPLVLSDVAVLSSSVPASGGGVLALDALSVGSSLFQHDRCTLAGCVGGGLYTSGALTLTRTAFLSNTSDWNGSAAQAAGNVLVTGGVFQDNYSQADLQALYAQSNASISSSLFRSNQGGGLFTLGSLTLTDTNFLSNTRGSRGGGAYATGSAVVTGGLFQGNQCTQAGCLGGGLATLATLTLSGTQFLGNSSTGDGGGAFSNGDVTVSGGTLQANHCAGADCFGGGLFAQDALTLTGTYVAGNTSTSDGGGAFAGGSTVLSTGLFQDNHCSQSSCQGGGLETDATLDLTDTHFLSNSSLSLGGAAYVLQSADLHGGQFQANQCTGAVCQGGALYDFTYLTLSGTQFLDNVSTANGGAVVALRGPTMTGALFQNNRCTLSICHGAAVWTNGDAALTATQFLSNSSLSDGGALYAGGNVTLIGGLFQSNHCTGGVCEGGALFAPTNVTLSGTRFLSNTSQYSGGAANILLLASLNGGWFQGNQCGPGCFGGGLYAQGQLAVTNTTFLNNQAQEGGGLFGVKGRLVNSLFAGNLATDHGDALYLSATGGVTLLHTTIASATVGSGAAVYIDAGTVGLTNTLIANYKLGLEQAGGTVWQDYALFSGVTTAVSGTVSSGGHVQFSGPADFVSSSAGNYHLGAGSAAIDTGVDAGISFDIDGQSRPIGAGFDIGYDEADLANLGVSLTDGQTVVKPGQVLTYTVTVTNAGPHAASGALLRDTLPATLTGATWSCLASLGSGCPVAGSGDIAAPITLLPGGQVVFTLRATLSGNAAGTLVNTAQVLLPVSIQDSALANNTATDVDQVQARLYLPLVRK